jgi:NAD-dependent deacetylase
MVWEAEVEQAAQMLADSTHAVALTGAGHSTPSGIPDFRSPGSGLWEQSDPMAVASIWGFQRDPRAFYDWIRPLIKSMTEAEPNPAHHALAEMERLGVLQAVITQNIDHLHQRAGSQRVLELHGSGRHATCTACRAKHTADELLERLLASDEVPACRSCGGALKPDVVLFGELLPMGVLFEAQGEASRCDVMMVVGSSLEVHPAAELPSRAKRHGAELIIINFQPTHMDAQAAVAVHDDLAAIVPRILEGVTQLRGAA